VLPEFTSSAEFTQLATAFKRVRNIARELPRARARICRAQRAGGGRAAQETASAAAGIGGRVRAGDYRAASRGGEVRPPVDKFFADVFVMVDDRRLRTRAAGPDEAVSKR
jgi:glycyl-tRNA synthetase beta subunit